MLDPSIWRREMGILKLWSLTIDTNTFHRAKIAVHRHVYMIIHIPTLKSLINVLEVDYQSSNLTG